MMLASRWLWLTEGLSDKAEVVILASAVRKEMPGRTESLLRSVTMMDPTLIIAPPPAPATALARIRVPIDGANPHPIVPIPKNVRAVIIAPLLPMISQSLP